jgi:hypothetical protein
MRGELVGGASPSEGDSAGIWLPGGFRSAIGVSTPVAELLGPSDGSSWVWSWL